MGAWNESINGNDTALDLKDEYQAAFFHNDVETALAKIDAYVRMDFDESDEEEWSCYYYSLADYMWKHGILTDGVRDRAVAMIDSGFGLDIWAESGKSVLRKREKVLSAFREKLLSPQPPKKKIRLKLHMQPVFETGDLVAIQLKTAALDYVRGSRFTEEEFRNADGKFVVLRKVRDKTGFRSAIEPSVKDYWAMFQLYNGLFDQCPTPDQLREVPIVPTREPDNSFTSESSLFYFRKRNYRVIGNDPAGIEANAPLHGVSFLFFGVNRPWANPETTILHAVLKGEILK